MTTITHPDLASVVELASWTPGPVVSIYLPADPLRREDDLSNRLRSATQWAKEALVTDHGLDAAAATTLLADLVDAAHSEAALAEAGLAPDPTSPGAAWFVAAGRVRCVSLPVAPASTVEIADGPDLLSLLPTLAAGPTFYVIAVSQKRARFFRADRYEIEPIPVPDMPHGLEDALWYQRREPGLSRHGSGVIHGQGGGQDLRKDDVHQYLRQVDKALAPILAGSQAPLVVIGVGFEAAMFVNETHYRHVVPTPVLGNPDSLDVATLHERAYAVASSLPSAATAAAERAREFAGTGRTLMDPAEIAAAAAIGSVSDVLVAASLTAGGGAETATPRPPAGARARIVVAVNAAMAAGAAAHVVSDSELPGGGPIAAILRY